MKEDKCIDCGKVMLGLLSTHRLCPRCAHARQMESARQIRERKGPIYEKWKEGLMRSVEG